MFENHLLTDIKNHAADLGPVLVDTCSTEKSLVLKILQKNYPLLPATLISTGIVDSLAYGNWGNQLGFS